MSETVDFGPCQCCQTSSGDSGSGGSGDPCDCPLVSTLTLDFNGETISLSGGPGSWSGTGTPGTCVLDWTFEVTCLGQVWTLFITNPNSATCVLDGPDWLGDVLSCDPLFVEFKITVSTPPMTPCCLEGSFPRMITASLSL